MPTNRAELEAALRALAIAARNIEGPDSVVPQSLELFADLVAAGPMDHAALVRAMLDEGWSVA